MVHRRTGRLQVLASTSNSHTNTKLNCRILTISQNVMDGVTLWISEIVIAWPPMWTTSRVSTVQCVATTLFLTLEQVCGRIKSLSVNRSTSMLTGKFFLHKHFVPPTGSCFSSAARKNKAKQAHICALPGTTSLKDWNNCTACTDMWVNDRVHAFNEHQTVEKQRLHESRSYPMCPYRYTIRPDGSWSILKSITEW